MKRFIEGEDRTQVTLLPACLEDYVEAENPVRVVEVFVDGLDLDALGFVGVDPAATGRPAYHPAVLLKLYIYGYLNRIQSSRRLEREAQRNVELMWLSGRLMPDFKTIANFRKGNGLAIRKVCRQFIVLCRKLELFTEAIVAICSTYLPANLGTAHRLHPRPGGCCASPALDRSDPTTNAKSCLVESPILPGSVRALRLVAAMTLRPPPANHFRALRRSPPNHREHRHPLLERQPQDFFIPSRPDTQ